MIWSNYCSLTIVSCLISLGTAQVKSYKDRMLVQLPPNLSTIDQLGGGDANIWLHTHDFVRAEMSRDQFIKLNDTLPNASDMKILIRDLQAPIDNASNSKSRRSDDWFGAYHNYQEIYTWFENHSKNNPDVVKFVPQIGKSVEGRNIFAVHLTNPNNSTKRQIWFQSLIHSPEWITGTSVQFIFDHLLKNRLSNEIINSFLDRAEVVIIPIVNPDGYEYSRTDRYWRKNRQPYGDGIGVDLNRNFPYMWGGPGSSNNPKDYNYRGPSSNSEPETQTVVSYYKSQHDIIAAIDFHSYSELILRPYAFTEQDSPHEAKFIELGEGMKSEIAKVSGKQYKSQKWIKMYPGSGTASDWFYNHNNAYGLTIELTPKMGDNRGFVLPPSEIIPVGKDILSGVIYFIDFVLNNPLN